STRPALPRLDKYPKISSEILFDFGRQHIGNGCRHFLSIDAASNTKRQVSGRICVGYVTSGMSALHRSWSFPCARRPYRGGGVQSMFMFSASSIAIAMHRSTMGEWRDSGLVNASQ